MMRAGGTGNRAPVTRLLMTKPIVTTAAASMHSAINWRMRLKGGRSSFAQSSREFAPERSGTRRGQRVANYYSRNGVRGYCPFAAPRPGVTIARAAGELTETRSGRQDDTIEGDGDLGGRAGSARRPLARRTAAASIQNNSGLAQGPAAHSTGRLEVRQTDCAAAVA